MSVFVLDAGYSVIKAKIARRDRGELAFPHALKLLSFTVCLMREFKLY